MTEFGKLLDEHMSLFREQMRNWDDFRAYSKRIGLASFCAAILIFVTGVLSLKEQSSAALAGPCIAFALLVVARVSLAGFFWLRHRRIDRDLESKKTELATKLEELINNDPEKKPVGVISTSVSFTRERRREIKRKLYSPWDDFKYEFYWR